MQKAIAVALLPFTPLNPYDRASKRLAMGLRGNLLTSIAEQAGLKVFSESYQPNDLDCFKGFLVSGTFAISEECCTLLLSLIKEGETQKVFFLEKKRADIQQLEKSAANMLLSFLLPSKSGHYGKPKPLELSQNAYEHELLARYYLKKFTPKDTDKAIALFDIVLREQPRHSLSLSGKAAATFQQLRYGAVGITAYESVRDWVQQALRYDLENIEAHTITALVAMYHDKDFYAAGISFQNALELGQDYVSICKEYCWFLLAIGQDEQAISAIEKALEYDPLSLHLICTKADLLRYMERYKVALQWYQKAYQLDRSYTRSIEGITACYTFLDNRESAYQYLEMYNRSEANQYWRYRLSGELAVHFNDDDLYNTSLNALEAYAKANPTADLSSDFMSVYAERNTDLAMAYLRKAFDAGVGLVSILRYPVIKKLKKRQDYKELVKSLQLNFTPTDFAKADQRIVHIKTELSERLTLPKAFFIFAEADGNYTKVYYLQKGQLEVRLLRIQLGALAAQLKEDTFLRIHNSFLLNVRLPETTLLGNAYKAKILMRRYNVELPVSRKVYPALKSIFGKES